MRRLVLMALALASSACSFASAQPSPTPLPTYTPYPTYTLFPTATGTATASWTPAATRTPRPTPTPTINARVADGTALVAAGWVLSEVYQPPSYEGVDIYVPAGSEDLGLWTFKLSSVSVGVSERGLAFMLLEEEDRDEQAALVLAAAATLGLADQVRGALEAASAMSAVEFKVGRDLTIGGKTVNIRSQSGDDIGITVYR